MGILQKMGKAMGHAMVEAGKRTAAAIKRKNLQNKVKRMILERFTIQDLKRLFKGYGLTGPPLPERGYYKKSDYVNYAYHNFKLKTVIEWAKRHRIGIKDIMDYYIAEMERIDRQYGKTKAEDRKKGVEEIEVRAEDFEALSGAPSLPPSSWEEENTKPWDFEDPDKEFFHEILGSIKNEYAPTVENVAFVDELAFKNHLKSFLEWKYKREGHHIRFQPQSVDLIIDDKIGLELKFATNRGTLTKGYEEVIKYQRLVKYIAIVILDPGKYPDKVEEAVEDYRRLGAEVLVIKGGRKRELKRGRKEIRIRM